MGAPAAVRVLTEEWRRQLAADYTRLVFKVAHSLYRGSPIPDDAICEGNIGLCIAAGKFDPSRNLKFTTYAVYWIRAYIINYMLYTKGPVKIGTSKWQRAVFFKLGKATQSLSIVHGADVTDEQIARHLGVDVEQLQFMRERLREKDISLDFVPEGHRAFELVDASADQEANLAEAQQQKSMRDSLAQAMQRLDPRERHIIEMRFYGESDCTLADVGRDLGLSRERIRQLEERAMKKLRGALRLQEMKRLAKMKKAVGE